MMAHSSSEGRGGMAGATIVRPARRPRRALTQDELRRHDVRPARRQPGPAADLPPLQGRRSQAAAWQQEIFDADHSHKCPTYVQSTPPCQGSCPSGEDIRGYLNIVRGIEKPPAGVPWQEYAWRRLTEANPLPSVMGRVCPAPCESGCNRNEVEDFVGINSVEHFLGEYAIDHELSVSRAGTATGKKVAVIGGGPAGLSAAYQLARKGHAVTIFDERAELGGMMRYGIPGFRTPRSVLDAEISRILDAGRGPAHELPHRQRRDLGRVEAQIRRRVPRPGCAVGPAAAGRGRRGAQLRHRHRVPEGVQRRPHAHVGRRVVVVGGGDTSIDVATVARRLGHIEQLRESDRPEHAIAGMHGPRRCRGVGASGRRSRRSTSIFADRQDAGQQSRGRARAGRGHRDPRRLVPLEVLRDASGRATGLRIARCEAKLAGGRLEMKTIDGTEEDIEADLIVSAIGQAVDFTGLEALNNGKGAHRRRPQLPVQGKPGVFVGGDVRASAPADHRDRPGAIAAEGIDRHLRGEPQDKRPKIDVHAFDLMRKMLEKGLPVGEIHEPLRGTDASAGAVHNFENRSDRYVIAHKELFLGHFPHMPRHKRKVAMLSAEQALNNFEERVLALSEAEASPRPSAA